MYAVRVIKLRLPRRMLSKDVTRFHREIRVPSSLWHPFAICNLRCVMRADRPVCQVFFFFIFNVLLNPRRFCSQYERSLIFICDFAHLVAECRCRGWFTILTSILHLRRVFFFSFFSHKLLYRLFLISSTKILSLSIPLASCPWRSPHLGVQRGLQIVGASEPSAAKASVWSGPLLQGWPASHPAMHLSPLLHLHQHNEAQSQISEGGLTVLLMSRHH